MLMLGHLRRARRGVRPQKSESSLLFAGPRRNFDSRRGKRERANEGKAFIGKSCKKYCKLGTQLLPVDFISNGRIKSDESKSFECICGLALAPEVLGERSPESACAARIERLVSCERFTTEVCTVKGSELRRHILLNPEGLVSFGVSLDRLWSALSGLRR